MYEWFGHAEYFWSESNISGYKMRFALLGWSKILSVFWLRVGDLFSGTAPVIVLDYVVSDIGGHFEKYPLI